MLSKSSKEEIRSYCEGTMDEYNDKLADMIELFDMALSVSGQLKEKGCKESAVGTSISKNINDYFSEENLPSRNQTREIIASLSTRYEVFLKMIYFLVHDEEAPEVGEYEMMGQLGLSSGSQGKKLYRVRKERNAKNVHGFETYSMREVQNSMIDLLGAYLYPCLKYRKYIEKYFSRQEQNDRASIEDAVNIIISECDKRAFNYVPLKWIETKSREERVINGKDDVGKTFKNQNRVLFIGTAGTGKTTAMMELAYIDAIKYRNQESLVIPVVIKMIEHRNESKIEALLAEELKTDESNVLDFLSSGKLHIYIDGINELIDEKLQSNVVNNVKRIASRYKNTFILITDRDDCLHLGGDFEENKYFIKPLIDKESIVDYVNKSLKDKADIREEVSSKIADFVDQKCIPNFHYTPALINRLIVIAKEGGKMPENEIEFAGCYIDSIIKREANEKSEPLAVRNGERLKRLYISLAGYMFNANSDDAKVDDVLNLFAEAKKVDANLDPTYALNLSCQLGILQYKEDGVVEFADPAFKEAFLWGE